MQREIQKPLLTHLDINYPIGEQEPQPKVHWCELSGFFKRERSLPDNAIHIYFSGKSIIKLSDIFDQFNIPAISYRNTGSVIANKDHLPLIKSILEKNGHVFHD